MSNMSELENDFDKAAEAINAKIKEAADAVREASRLARAAGLDGLIFTQWDREDVYRDNKHAEEPLDDDALDEKVEELQSQYEKIKVSELEGALGSAGWNTSSSYC